MVRRALNASVEFIDVVRVTHHVGSLVDYTPNIFIHSWGVNPTDTIPPNVSTITQCDYDPIHYFRGLVLQTNHKRIGQNRIELKHIRFKELLARIQDDVCDNVLNNACSPANRALGDALSNEYDSNDGWIDTYYYD